MSVVVVGWSRWWCGSWVVRSHGRGRSRGRVPRRASPCWALVLIAVVVGCYHPRSTLEQWLAGLGTGAGLFLVIVGPWCSFLSSYAGYLSCCWAWGVLFQGPSLQHVYNLGPLSSFGPVLCVWLICSLRCRSPAWWRAWESRGCWC